jgi:hypothetical protein
MNSNSPSLPRPREVYAGEWTNLAVHVPQSPVGVGSVFRGKTTAETRQLAEEDDVATLGKSPQAVRERHVFRVHDLGTKNYTTHKRPNARVADSSITYSVIRIIYSQNMSCRIGVHQYKGTRLAPTWDRLPVIECS